MKLELLSTEQSSPLIGLASNHNVTVSQPIQNNHIEINTFYNDEMEFNETMNNLINFLEQARLDILNEKRKSIKIQIDLMDKDSPEIVSLKERMSRIKKYIEGGINRVEL